jgi:hypothetical protein
MLCAVATSLWSDDAVLRPELDSERCPEDEVKRADVRYWHKADIGTRSTDVRFRG